MAETKAPQNKTKPLAKSGADVATVAVGGLPVAGSMIITKASSSPVGKGCLVLSLVALIILPILSFAVFFGAFVRIGGTWSAPTGNGTTASDGTGVYTTGPNCQEITIIRTTDYYVSSKYSSAQQAAVEGGTNDITGKPLQTLDKYLTGDYAGGNNYVSLAADIKESGNGHDTGIYSYGEPAYIPAIENSSLVGGKQINFRIVDTGQDFGSNSNKTDRATHPNQYVDIAISNASWEGLASLNQSNVAMYFGTGCTRSTISNQPTTMQAFKEKVRSTCNQVAVYTLAYYLAQQKGGNPSSISFPNFPPGTCATDGLLAQELEQAGFKSNNFTVHRESENLPNGASAYWGKIIPMLNSGTPVVMETNLYSDQVNQHWVTLASASSDGQTISYADPAKGAIETMSISNSAWGKGATHSYIYVTWNN